MRDSSSEHTICAMQGRFLRGVERTGSRTLPVLRFYGSLNRRMLHLIE